MAVEGIDREYDTFLSRMSGMCIISAQFQRKNCVGHRFFFGSFLFSNKKERRFPCVPASLPFLLTSPGTVEERGRFFS